MVKLKAKHFDTPTLKRKSLTRWAVLVFIAFSCVAFAEEVIKRSQVSEIDQTQYDKGLEDRLTRDVKSYLGHDFFIIRAGALLENVRIYDKTEKLVPAANQNQTAQQQAQQQQQQPQAQPPPPAIDPAQAEALSQMELETADGIDKKTISEILGVESPLPGLPVPDSVFEQSQQQEEERNQKKKLKQASPPPPQQQQPQVLPAPLMEKEVTETLRETRIDVKKLNVKIILDDHITTEQEVFIRQLVIDKSGLSFIRGDELQITRSKFPGATILDPKPEEVKPEEPPKPEPLPVEPPKPPEEEAAWLNFLKNYWPFILLAIALAIVLLILNRNKKKKEAKEKAEQEANRHIVKVPDITKKFEKLISEMSRKEKILAENRMQAIREEVVSMAVTDYSTVEHQLSDWLASGNDDDLAKVAILHNLLGQGTFTSLFRPILTAERLVALAAKSKEIIEQSQDNELIELAESVYQQLIQRRYDERTQKNQDMRPFEFLEELNDDQILYLLNDENLKVRALVYSQLPSNRASSLLKRASGNDRTKLATEISKFTKLPVLAFKDVANRLAKKAVNVPSFANIEVDGTDLLINMLDHMTLADETTMLTSLQRDNPQLYYQIKRMYISFTDLIKLPAMSLKNVLREIEREQLALALFDMDEAFRDSIGDALLERPRAMLIATLRNMNQPDPNAMSEAKRAVARKAREMLKAGAIQLEEAATTEQPQAATQA